MDTVGARAALCDESALLRHEAAYCLGQQNQPEAVPILQRLLDNASEDPMYARSEGSASCAATCVARSCWCARLLTLLDPCRVRHEAAEALGAINTPCCLQSLAQHQDDSCLEVPSDNLRMLSHAADHHHTSKGVWMTPSQCRWRRPASWQCREYSTSAPTLHRLQTTTSAP